MSNAPRPATWNTRSRSWAGQERALGQRMSASPSFSGRSSVPHSGQCVGMTNGRSEPSRAATTGPSTPGVPAPGLPQTTVAGGDDRAEHLGDDVAGLADDHGVADEDALALDLAGVVQGGQLDGGAGDLDRFHEGERGDPAGAPDVDPDVVQLGGGLLRLVLERDGPARRAAGRPEPALQGDLVDLHHDAVDLVLDRVTLLPVALDVGPHTLEVGDDFEA